MSPFFQKKTSTESTGESSADNVEPVKSKDNKQNTSGGGQMMGKKGESMSSAPTSSGSGGATGDVKAILGKGSEFEGKLRFEGTARVDGKFKGEVNSAGTLIIGEHATIEGELDVDGAIVSGEIKGNITAKSRIELHAPAKVYGNISTPVLVIQEGVIFEGECVMNKGGAKSTSSPSPSPAKDSSS